MEAPAAPVPVPPVQPIAQPVPSPTQPASPQPVAPATSAGASLIDFSERIHDPAFARYLKNSKRWSYIFSLILFAVAVIGFPIYGQKSGEIAMPQSLYYGIGIGGMFVVIAFFTNLSRSRDSTWDGVVVDKKVSKQVRRDEDSSFSTTTWIYETRVKRDSGKITKYRQQNNDTIYNYFQIGDRVRHHKGFSVYEKYDKSRDIHLFCIACAKKVEVSVDRCPRCKCPILK